MKRSRHNLIRELLLVSEDGLTVNQIAQAVGDDNPKSIQKTVKLIHGVYIDRWTVPKRGQFAAVYMCVNVPNNAPHPTERYVPQTMWQSSITKGIQ
ncbi:hypothetical protein UFOVP133_64 [uncultured Caudovirales phage]|uniref:Uncharacterized protein n=1 Tax=uncultured Caudovirales phage TaxID=2100421 RepID=A0A6J5L9U2_9CAUD|nr:hypothetical protein UFOVP133_64 [uncultured Caudovirales phage]